MNELKAIEEKIYKENPNISKELLELLYEYIMTRYAKEFKETVIQNCL